MQLILIIGNHSYVLVLKHRFPLCIDPLPPLEKRARVRHFHLEEPTLFPTLNKVRIEPPPPPRAKTKQKCPEIDYLFLFPDFTHFNEPFNNTNYEVILICIIHNHFFERSMDTIVKSFKVMVLQ